MPGGREVTLPLFLAHGVTGVRDMGSDLEPILAARRDVASGTLPGPRMIVSGPMLDGPKTQFPAALPIVTPEDGRRAVRMLKERGVDFIKIQSYVPRDAWFAIADECRRQKIVFAGHVPDAVRASEASTAGQKSFEHLIGVFEGSTPIEDAAHRRARRGRRAFSTPSTRRRRPRSSRSSRRTQTWQCPTLYWERGPVARRRRRRQEAIPTRSSRRPRGARRAGPSSRPGSSRTSRPIRCRSARSSSSTSSRSSRGSTRPASRSSPARTRRPASTSCRVSASTGSSSASSRPGSRRWRPSRPRRSSRPDTSSGRTTSAPWRTGRLADLVLLDADPTKDIANTRKISAVVANGRAYARADLDRMLADVEAYARTH